MASTSRMRDAASCCAASSAYSPSCAIRVAWVPDSTMRPAVDHVDHIGADHRREPVRDREGRAAAGRGIQRLLHDALRDGVQRGGRLVEQQHRRILQQHARDRDALLLAAGEPVAALADDRVVALLEPAMMWWMFAARHAVLELLLSRLGLGVEQVLADRGVEQVGLLRDDARRRR